MGSKQMYFLINTTKRNQEWIIKKLTAAVPANGPVHRSEPVLTCKIQ